MENSGFFDAKLVGDSYDRIYLAETFAKYFARFIGNGVFTNTNSSSLLVMSNETGMNVVVKAGAGWINGYWYENTTDLTPNIDIADGAFARIDLVVLRYDIEERTMGIQILKGTNATNPQEPSYTRDANYYDLVLAKISVPAGATKILQSYITDERLIKPYCGAVVALVEQIDTTEYGTQLNTFIQEYMVRANADYNVIINDCKTWVAQVEAVFTDSDVAALLAKVQALMQYSNYTYVIDSNDRFAQWCDNISGNDYTHVLVKSGTWSVTNRSLNLSTSETKTVDGEGGSYLSFTGEGTGNTYAIQGNGSIIKTNEYYFRNVGIIYNPSATSTNKAAIKSLANVENVYVNVADNTGNTGGIDGFNGCMRLSNCVASVKGRVGTTSGFTSCSYVTGCYSNVSAVSGTKYNFQSCEFVMNCECSGTVADEYHNCTNCIGGNVNNLNATKPGYALDATQGKILNEKFLTVEVIADATDSGKIVKAVHGTKSVSKTIGTDGRVVVPLTVCGTWIFTISGGASKSIDLPYYGTYELNMALGYKQWLESAGITTTFASLSALLADEKTVRELFTKHASCDYFIQWYDGMPGMIDDFTVNRVAMKWIGLRDYICDKLMAIDEVKTKLLASEYWEYILKDHVPTMTSNTAPEGVATVSSSFGSGYEAYRAFDKNDTTLVRTPYNVYSGQLSYNFGLPICIKKVYLKNGNNSTVRALKNFTIDASNDGTTWVTLGTFTNTNNETSYEQYFSIHDNINNYIYYRINFTSGYGESSSFVDIGELDFYGRSLNESVPCMTSNTAPLGEVSASSGYSSSYMAFDKSIVSGSTWVSSKTIANATGEYIQYEFLRPILCKFITINWVGTTSCKYAIQGSNDNVTFYDIQTFEDTSLTNSHFINNDICYKIYRLILTAPQQSGSNTYAGNVRELQFYGVSYSEEEFGDDGIEMLYDNGVELVQMEVNNSGTTIATKTDDMITLLVDSSASGIPEAYIKTKKDLTPYKLLRGSFTNSYMNLSGGHLDVLSSVPINGTTWANRISYNMLNNLNIPNNNSLDISSLNAEYFVGVAMPKTNTSDTSKKYVEVTKLWLEK